MAYELRTRSGLPRWTSPGDAFTREQLNDAFEVLDVGGALFRAGPLSERGDPGDGGVVFWSVDEGRFYYDNGSAWVRVALTDDLSGAISSHTHDAAAITSGQLAPARVPDLDAGKVTSGTFAVARVPNLDASKVTTGQLPVARGGTGRATLTNGQYVVGAGTGGVITRSASDVREDIDAAPASHAHTAAAITSGVFADARIPNLDAGKVTGGVFALARIPGLPATQLTSGTLPVARGGTGVSSVAVGSVLAGVGTGPMMPLTPTQLRDHVGALPTSHDTDANGRHVNVSGAGGSTGILNDTPADFAIGVTVHLTSTSDTMPWGTVTQGLLTTTRHPGSTAAVQHLTRTHGTTADRSVTYVRGGSSSTWGPWRLLT